eukprot:CAMPEP_0114990980 /NCGR_PEP_ID=MMETSP0216-20121206/11105_1 /TAXON_ID=223996 /ORGANISM="Protocruzia adherens, Strain Boccale" /LENGTH=395 /DNA_ID=CAMNT_0002354231 /DNA_START=343 /DNA_END=1530 /DNA_ORIENTATION=-
MGCKNALTRQVAFFPPSPAGYTVEAADDEETKNPVKICDATTENGNPLLLSNLNGDSFRIIEKGKQNRLPDLPWIKVNAFYLHPRPNRKVCCLYLQWPRAEFTILYSHGNSTDLGGIAKSLIDMAENLKCNVISYDYAGYGLSDGVTTEDELYQNIKCVYKYLTITQRISFSKIILYGFSVGSGPSVDLAADPSTPVGGAVLHGGLASGLTLISGDPGAKWEVFDNISKMPRVACPVFIIHGGKDKTIPRRNGELLYESCRRPFTPWWVPEGDHFNIETKFRAQYYHKLISFTKYLRIFHLALTDVEKADAMRAEAMISRSAKTSREGKRKQVRMVIKEVDFKSTASTACSDQSRLDLDSDANSVSPLRSHSHDDESTLSRTLQGLTIPESEREI